MVDFVVRLADMGKRIVIAGLDTDYLGRPFHPMPEPTRSPKRFPSACSAAIRPSIPNG
jgi:hypothetical protein